MTTDEWLEGRSVEAGAPEEGGSARLVAQGLRLYPGVHDVIRAFSVAFQSCEGLKRDVDDLAEEVEELWSRWVRQTDALSGLKTRLEAAEADLLEKQMVLCALVGPKGG